MPCGFEENLMDFECSGGVAGSWTTNATDFDPDPLLMVSLNNKDADVTGSKTDSSWCRSNSRSSSSMNGLAGSGSSSGGNNGLSSSSYCRRLGSANGGGGGSGGGSNRRSATFQLWSPRLRLRDERKRVLKLSLAKLRRIDDAESCLRRSVLLNNTLKRLQCEARDEKATPPPLLHPASESRSVLTCDESNSIMDEATPPRAGIKRRRSADVCEELNSTSSSMDLCSSGGGSGGLNFGDLYLPPVTPRMISSLEDEEEAEAWCVKRPKITTSSSSTAVAGNDVSGGRNRPALRPCNSMASATTSSSPSTTATTTSTPTAIHGHASLNSLSVANQNQSPIIHSGGYTSSSCLTSGLSLVNSSSTASNSAAQQSYSCGQSSLFGELQSVVFHSLITSLES